MAKNEVTVQLDGKEFAGWTSIEIRTAMDNFSQVSLVAPFDPESKLHRDAFRPFKFRDIEVRVDAELVFTGTLVGIHPSVSSEGSTVSLTAYALPGVLQDCPAPASLWPIEFRNVGLEAITAALVKPWGLSALFPDGAGPIFEKVAPTEEEKLHSFFSKLARQRNRVLTNTAGGQLLYWKSVGTGNPVARLTQQEPVVSVSPTFAPQSYYSEITGVTPTKRGRAGAKHTEPNPFLPGVLRPFTTKLDDTEPGETEESTKATLGRMFGNVASFAVEGLPTWRTPGEALWQGNKTVTLKAPHAMVYQETELLIRAVTLYQDASTERAALDLVLPGAFSGEAPESQPWDD